MLVVAVWLLAQVALPCHAQAPAADAGAALPARTGELKGTLQRGEDGKLRIVPTESAQPPTARSVPLPPPGSGSAIDQAVGWAHRRVHGIGGYDHGLQARAIQAEINALMAREQHRKTLAGSAGITIRGLTPAEQSLVARLTERDREVRRHEMLHYQTGLPYTQQPQFWFVTGPDGRRYAVSGQVGFVMSKLSGKASDLLAQLQVLQRAALAPHQPSSQDLAVARQLGEVIRELRHRAALNR